MTVTPQAGLLTSLLAVQAELPTLPKNGENPHFKSKFTPLDTIVEIVGPILSKNGLVWSALPCSENGRPALRYRLAHAATGEAIEDVMPLLLSKEDSQGLGSALTYARRYALSAVLNLVSDEDDDGNQASRRRESPQPVAKPVEQTARAATAKQRSLIFAKAGESGMSASQLANVVLIATGNEQRDFGSEERAQDWLKRSLDRLPANRVDPILEVIGGHA